MAALIVTSAEIWAWIGLAVSVPFLLWGIDRVEPNSRTSYTFRPLLIPGIVLLWPLVLWRWGMLEAQRRSGRDNWAARHSPRRGLHGPIWRVVALLIPAILVAGLLLRQNGPLERPAVMLEAPS